MKEKIDKITERILNNIYERIEEYISNPRKEKLRKIRRVIDNATGEILREKFSEEIKSCYHDNFDKLLRNMKLQLVTNATYKDITPDGEKLINKIKENTLSDRSI